MKQKLIFLLTILGISLILTISGCSKGSKTNHQKEKQTKVERFVDDIRTSIKCDKNFSYSKKIESYDFTLEEYIEVQNKLSEGLDDKFFNKQIDFKKSSDERTNYFIVYSMKTHFITKWYKTLPKEEIVYEKVLPIVKNSNDMLRYLWLREMSYLLMDIHNKKLPFNEENKNKTMDELISIFTNKENRIEIKYNAFYAWPFCETREDKIYEVFNILLNDDEELFMLTGRHFARFTLKAPTLFDLMFNILDNRQNYSDEIVLGALSFFENSGIYGENEGDLGIERRIKLKILSQEIIESDQNKEIIEKAEEILEIFEYMEKKGNINE